MRFRRAVLYSIASAAVMLVSPAPSLILEMPLAAQAANVSVSINTFYSDLAPYGSWVSYRDDYVFIPGRIAADWRPYTEGHWVYTRLYGWLWVSDEPFGWATYHYGRWGYADDIGWYWVPGRRWAPAWVSWRRSRDHVVWAPLPPRHGGDVSIDVRISDIPDYYWVAVPSRDFLDVDLRVAVIHDDTERVRVIHDTRPIGGVSVRNNVVVNNAVDVDYVQKTTNKKVETVNVKETDNPQQAGKGSNGEVAVFNGDVKEDKTAKPTDVKDVETIKKQRAQAGGTQQGQQPSTTTQEQGTTPGQEQPTTKKKKPTTSEQPSQSQQGQGTEQQPTKKKKPTMSEQPSQSEQGQGTEQPTKKKKLNASGQPSQSEQGQGAEQPIKKKKPNASEQPNQSDQGQSDQGSQQKTKRKKSNTSEPTQGEQKQQGCDQATGEGC